MLPSACLPRDRYFRYPPRRVWGPKGNALMSCFTFKSIRTAKTAASPSATLASASSIRNLMPDIVPEFRSIPLPIRDRVPSPPSFISSLPRSMPLSIIRSASRAPLQRKRGNLQNRSFSTGSRTQIAPPPKGNSCTILFRNSWHGISISRVIRPLPVCWYTRLPEHR